MPGLVKVGGAWRTLAPKVKVGGAWKNVTNGYVKVAGVWRKWHQSLVTVDYNYTIFDTNNGAKQLVVPVVAGDWVIVMYASSGALTSGSVTDSAGGTYGNAVSAVGTGKRCGIFMRGSQVASTGNLTITHTPGPSDTGGGFTVMLMRGGASTANIYTVGQADNVSSGVPTVNLSATPQANECVIGIMVGGVGSPPAAGTDYLLTHTGSWTTPGTTTSGQFRNGNASATVAWGASATAFGACAAAFRPY